MSVKSIAAKIFAQKIYKKTQAWAMNPVASQQAVFKSLIRNAKQTQFGTDHNFGEIKTFEDFAKNVPIRDYEDLKS